MPASSATVQLHRIASLSLDFSGMLSIVFYLPGLPPDGGRDAPYVEREPFRNKLPNVVGAGFENGMIEAVPTNDPSERSHVFIR